MSVKVMRRLGTWLLLVCVLIILIPQSASAHAYVVKSNPTENETLKKAPSVVKSNSMRTYKFQVLIHCT